MFQLGDIGYVPAGKDFKSFVLLSNILKDGTAELEINLESTGWRTHMSSSGFDREQLQPFDLPGDVSGYGKLPFLGAQRSNLS